MYSIENLSVGKIIRKYRKIKHLSMEQVGKIIGKTKATISKYEKDEIIPDFLTTLEICNVLNVSLDTLFPESLTTNLPFNSNCIYMYYLTENKLISSTIEFINNSNAVRFYNGIKNEDKENCAYYYEGTFEYLENMLYINLKNLSSPRLEMERVQIIISLPLSNSNNCFNCFMTGLTPNYIPTIKKGIITASILKETPALVKKLEISKEELREISSNNSWIMNIKLYDEFFYNFGEKLTR